MKKLFCLLAVFLSFWGCQKAPSHNTKNSIIVSIAPFKKFVNKIAGPDFEVVTIVPEGANSHTYEPSPKEISRLKDALIWFQIGDPFEKKLAKTLKEKNPALVIQDLNEDIDLIPYSDSHGHHHHGYDIHTWLDPMRALIQLETIRDTLIAKFPEKKETFQKNYQTYAEQIQDLHLEIASELTYVKNRTFITSHPSFTYFCKAYRFKQISIETEGKDPLPQDLHHLLLHAKEKGAKVVIIEPQFSSKGAIFIANQLKIPTKLVDPYSYDYEKMLLRLTCILKNAGKSS